jgi:hypothetical protein
LTTLRLKAVKHLVFSASAISSSGFLRAKKAEGSRLQIASQQHVTGGGGHPGIGGRITPEYARILQTPEVVTQMIAALKQKDGAVSEADAIAALHEFNALWSQLFPAEQARIIQLLVRRVTVTAAGLEVDIRREGIAGVIREMLAPRRMEAAE